MFGYQGRILHIDLSSGKTRIEEFSECKLAVEGLLVPLDVQRCAYYREVKAVTYHELAIREIEGGFEAIYIVDI